MVATSLSNVTLPAFTAYGDTPIYQGADGALSFGLLRDPVISDPTDQVYTVTQPAEARLDLISALFYGTPHLWWVIALVNNIVDPLLGAPTGAHLRIPARERLTQAGILAG